MLSLEEALSRGLKNNDVGVMVPVSELAEVCKKAATLDRYTNGQVATMRDGTQIPLTCMPKSEAAELREKAAVLDRLEAAFATPTVYTWEVIPPHVQKERMYCLIPIGNVVSIDGATPIELYCGATIAEALANFEAENGGAA